MTGTHKKGIARQERRERAHEREARKEPPLLPAQQGLPFPKWLSDMGYSPPLKKTQRPPDQEQAAQEKGAAGSAGEPSAAEEPTPQSPATKGPAVEPKKVVETTDTGRKPTTDNAKGKADATAPHASGDHQATSSTPQKSTNTRNSRADSQSTHR